jgi:endonuclease/exonuclease/phosphatase family metal-dependent hydrolase
VNRQERMYKKHLAFFAVVVLLCMGIAWNEVHKAEGRSQSKEAYEGCQSFLVMTFNVGDAAERVFLVADTAACILAKGRPDILFLQEMPGARAGVALQAALAYPYGSRAREKAGKLAELRVLSMFPIVETREIPLPSQEKGAGALCAVLNMDGQRVVACSVHLDEVAPKTRNSKGEVCFTMRQAFDFLYAEVFADTVRTKGVRALIHSLAEDVAGMPVILAGDFNTVPGSRTIRRMGNLFHDVLWPGAAYLTGTYHKIAFPIAPRIDYIFVSDGLAVDRARVIQQSAGDHYPVVAWLRLTS